MTNDRRPAGRRSISVSTSTYERIRSYCEEQGITKSALIEALTSDLKVKS